MRQALIIIFGLMVCSLSAQNFGTIGQPGGSLLNVDSLNFSFSKTKGSSQTVSSTTMTDISDLVFSLEANSTYKYEYHLFFAPSPAGGLKIGFAYDSTVPSFRYGYIATETGTFVNPTNITIHPNNSSPIWYIDAASSNNMVFMLSGEIQTTSAGNFRMQFANYDSDGGSNICRYGSWGMITKIN